MMHSLNFTYERRYLKLTWDRILQFIQHVRIIHSLNESIDILTAYQIVSILTCRQ